MNSPHPAPNDDAPRHPNDTDAGRNDPAIDPQGAPGIAPASGKDNPYVPPGDTPRKPSADGPSKDADIDTDGG